MHAFAILLMLSAAAGPAVSQQLPKCPAKLKKWSSFPAVTLVAPPSDAPPELAVSGKFAGPGNRRVSTVGALGLQCSSVNRARCTDYPMPVPLQPVQGLSGIETIRNKDGVPTDEFWQVTDNGYGNMLNSPDCTIMFHKIRANFTSKKSSVQQTIFLNDPDKKMPFPIRLEGTSKRYLTGGDLDTESIQHIKDSVYVGDEFGPYLVEADAASGKVLAVYDITYNGTVVRSPDGIGLQLANPGAASPNVTLRRSRGFEGMAASPDKKYLYPMLEGALYDTAGRFFENVTNPRTNKTTEYLRIWKFNTETKQFEGNGTLKYMLEVADHAIGDFNMIDDKLAMVIERDNNEGDPGQGCKDGNFTATCYEAPAAFKRVYLIDISSTDSNGFVKKIAYADLMDIDDPDSICPFTNSSKKLNLPAQTIEDVDVYDAKSSLIVVGNDDNFPYSSSRRVGKADDNELLVLEVPGFFNGGKC